MTQPGSVVEVQVNPRGSHVVGDHVLGDTTVLVEDPTPFDPGGQVLIDGLPYTYTAADTIVDPIDPTSWNGMLTLAVGLVAGVTDGTPVEEWNGDQVLDDVVLIVATGEEGDPPTPITATVDQRSFWAARQGPLNPPVAVLVSDDLEKLLDAPGYTPSIDGSALVGFPDPVTIAVDPPANSPAITTVQGNRTGLTVVTEPVLPTTLLDFLIDGVVVAADQRTTVINLTKDGGGADLVAGTAYDVTVQAHNAATDLDPTLLPAASAAVTGQLDLGLTEQQVTAMLVAGFILAGTIQVGTSMTLDGTGGFTITHPDGRQTYMRADGSGNQFVGQAVLDAATILGSLTILGQTNNLNGLLTLGKGVTDPTGKPAVTSSGYDSVGNTGGASYGFLPRGLYDNGSSFTYTDNLLNSGNVNVVDKTTGARTFLFSCPSGFGAYGGVVRVSGNYYVLGTDNNRSQNWYCYVFNSSGVKTGEWLLKDTGGTTIPATHSCAIGLDGLGNLLIARRSVTGNFTINGYSLAGVASAAAGTYPTWVDADITGVLKIAVDTATVRYVVSSANDGIRVFNLSTAARVPGEEWAPAATPVCGLGHDGTNFRTMKNNTSSDTSAKLYKYTNLIGTWDFAFTWYDSDAGGLGLAETKRSDIRTIAPTKRSKWTVSLPSPPPDDGTTDGANTGRLYAVTTGGTLVLQTTLAEPTLTQTYSTLATVGSAPPGANGFASRPGAVGRVASAAVDGSSNPYNDVKGDGSGRVGPLVYGTTGLRTETNTVVTGGSHTTPAGAAAFRYPTGLAESTFVAPLSGKVRITAKAYLKAATDGTELGICPEVRAGGTIRSGTVVLAADVNDMASNRNVQVTRQDSSVIVTGLTPGATYNAYIGVWSAAVSCLVNNTKMVLEPVL